MIKFETSKGDMFIELFTEKAPVSTKNFLEYVESGFYDGTIFHRVIDNFMIQGGGFTEDMEQKPAGEPIQNEANNGLSNKKYTLAMARLPMPHSATCQFFINVNDNPHLDFVSEDDSWGYAVFGEVVKGQDVVDAIRGVPTSTQNRHQNVPVEPVVLLKVTVQE